MSGEQHRGSPHRSVWKVTEGKTSFCICLISAVITQDIRSLTWDMNFMKNSRTLSARSRSCLQIAILKGLCDTPIMAERTLITTSLVLFVFASVKCMVSRLRSIKKHNFVKKNSHQASAGKTLHCYLDRLPRARLVPSREQLRLGAQNSWFH